MDEKKSTAQLREKIRNLKLKNQNLEKLILHRANEFEKTKSTLEEQVAQRTHYLQEQKEQLQAITENVPGVVYQFYSNNNGEAGVHYVSPKLTEIFGIVFIEDGARFFQKFSENIHEEDKQIWFESIQEAIQKQIPWKWRGRYVKSTGEVVWFEGHSIPTVRKDEIIFDGIFIDITHKIEQEMALKQAKEAVEATNNELEQRVADRTAQLDRKTERLMETNVALKILLEKREEDKKELEEKVMYNVEKLIYPWLEKLKTRCNKDSQKAFLETIRLNLDEITSSFAHKHNNYLSNLTPAQIQIANLIKQGQTTKEIASLLDLSPSTIACHRQEIRKRLFLTNKKTNLQTALTFIP
jgi:DNA-binding CsgD family transcriptional regulator/PAS domain-containing protein